ncbi:MAG: carbohydrate ABC transporter permease [Clostridia bacterium]|nr:carbohydrate ABC transporter permease [Clostridia bacterium]
MSTKTKEIIYTVVVTAICAIVALACLYPLVYSVLVSFCAPHEINASYFLPIPENFTIRAYVQVFTAGNYILTAIGVSLFRTVVGTVLSVIACALLAYAVSRQNLPGRGAVIKVLLFCILFGGGMIPTYLVIESLGLLNTIWVYIIPNIMNVWNVIIIKQFFEGLPRDTEEAAAIDGANEWRIFISVVLPMSKPVIAAISLFTMVGQWNSWFDAFLYVSQEFAHLWPLQYYIQISFNNLNQINQGKLDDLIHMIESGAADDMSIKMALTVVGCLPIMIVYPFFQKYFAKGVYVGSVKG